MRNSSAFERWVGLLCEASDTVGQSFLSVNAGELSALPTRDRKSRKDERAAIEGHQLGITPMLGFWLREADCGGFKSSSEVRRRLFGKYAVLPEKPYAVRLPSGSMAHDSFVKVAVRLMQGVRHWLLSEGVVGIEDYDDLCVEVAEELMAEDFCGLAFVVRVWGRRL